MAGGAASRNFLALSAPTAGLQTPTLDTGEPYSASPLRSTFARCHVIGQIIAVFAIVIVAIWGATQWGGGQRGAGGYRHASGVIEPSRADTRSNAPSTDRISDSFGLIRT
jgi:hypothetical protein